MMLSKFVHVLLWIAAVALSSSCCLASSSSSIIVPVINNNNNQDNNILNVPFHIKKDEDNGNVIAVIYYGNEDDKDKDTDKTLEIPCQSSSSSNTKGPNIVRCYCSGETTNDGKHRIYDLVIPFRFERNGDGDIVSVVFDESDNEKTTTSSDDIMDIPFYIKRNENGEIVAVIYDPFDEEDEEEPWISSPCAIIGMVLLGLFMFMIAIVWHKWDKKTTKETTTTTTNKATTTGEEDDDQTTTHSSELSIDHETDTIMEDVQLE